MDFAVHITGNAQPNYPVRVGFSCKNGDSYTYPYSQLPHSDISNVNMIEEPDGVYQSIAGFSTDPAVLEDKWRLTSSDITYSNSATGVPSYAHRGIYVFVLKSIDSHPVLDCNIFLDNATAITYSNAPEKCPPAIVFMTDLTYPSEVVQGYTFYSIPAATGSSERRICGYDQTTGILFPPYQHASVAGANIYRYFRASQEWQ